MNEDNKLRVPCETSGKQLTIPVNDNWHLRDEDKILLTASKVIEEKSEHKAV